MKYSDLLTVIITASYIKSHPDVFHIKRTIESLSFLEYPKNTKIILSHDYPSDENNLKNYLQYYEKLKEMYKNNKNIFFTMLEKYGNLTGSIRNAFNFVESKYVLLVQHDFPFVRKVDLMSIMGDMENDAQLKHIRFNKRKNVRAGADTMTADLKIDIFNNFNIKKNNTYISTFMWSDNNHISPSDYYRNIILKECRDKFAMENIIYPELKKLVQNENIENIIETHKKYGTYIYDEISSDQVIYHTDGRNN